MSLGLVIPLFNEEALVADVVADIHRLLDEAGIEHRLVLVNNGSRDGTGDIVDGLAQTLPVTALHLDKNAGYGGGILAGMNALLKDDDTPEVIGWSWGDGQVPAAVLPPLYRACVRGADLAKAVRTERHDGTWRKLVTTAYSETMRAFGCNIADVNGCPKLFRADVFARLSPTSTDWFIDAEVVLTAQALELEITHHPTVMNARAGGKSKVHLGTMAEFAWNLARWRATRRP